ncbi:MAG TPA: hypothetical protein VNI77_05215 [Nitrososphaera sp.]|nr:hypothetical protein [Nitrososphaera sp.]
MASGNRITHAWLILGGMRNDPPYGFEDRVLEFIDYFENRRLPECFKIFYDNPLFRQRSEGEGSQHQGSYRYWGAGVATQSVGSKL